MMLLEAPPASAGLQAWQAWLNELTRLSPHQARDASVVLAKQRAARMITILSQFPQGVDTQDAEFGELVRQLSA